jgi:LemA protein
VAAGSAVDSAGSVAAAAAAAEVAGRGDDPIGGRSFTEACRPPASRLAPGTRHAAIGNQTAHRAQRPCQESTSMNLTRQTLTAALVALLAVGASGCSYNTFVTQEEAIKAQWAEIQNQLQRRSDLIPNLVETVKGVTQQEQDVFGQIADARARLAGASTPAQTIDAANQQSAALSRLLVVVEQYPQLRSSESFNRLMDELSGTENRITTARRRYNEQVQTYNTSRRRFPSNITAGLFGFEDSYPLFDAPPEAEQVPQVDFGRGGA